MRPLWIIGLLAALGVFGVKAGLGLGTRIYRRSLPPGRKMVWLLGVAGLYLLLFVGLHCLISRFNLLDYLDRGLNLAGYGLFLALAVAAGLLFWGLILLLEPPTEDSPPSPLMDYFLIFPCPTATVVILLNLNLAYSFLISSHFAATLILFACFSGIIGVTLGLIYPFRHKISAYNSFLGITLTLVGLYVLGIMTITPIYPEIQAAFAMAASNQPVNRLDNFYIALSFLIAVLLVGAGFFETYFFRKGGLS